MLSPPCNQCKFYVPSVNPKLSGYCTRFMAMRPEQKTPPYEFAFVARMDRTLCGDDGRLFEKSTETSCSVPLCNSDILDL
jgi:hypothetical protein